MHSNTDQERKTNANYYQELQQHLDLLNDLETGTAQLRGEIAPLLDELRRSQAPFLTHQHRALRVLFRIINLLIYPWGRRQMKFNYTLLSVVEKCHERIVDLEKAQLILHRLEARLADHDSSS